MYIETRFYDDGKAMARLHKSFSYPVLDISDDYDSYVDSIGNSDTKVQSEFDRGSDYATLEDWVNQLVPSKKRNDSLLIDLETEEWIDITSYC